MTTEVREYINTHVYAIQCFLMLRFCHVIKYCSMWHVDAVGHHGAKSMSHSLEHVPVSYTHLTLPTSDLV